MCKTLSMSNTNVLVKSTGLIDRFCSKPTVDSMKYDDRVFYIWNTFWRKLASSKKYTYIQCYWNFQCQTKTLLLQISATMGRLVVNDFCIVGFITVENDCGKDHISLSFWYTLRKNIFRVTRGWSFLTSSTKQLHKLKWPHHRLNMVHNRLV